MAIGLRRPRPSGRQRPIGSWSVERRVYVKASPRTVWAALHDPANADLVCPELVPDETTSTWPAAAATRSGRARLGLLREPAVAESLEARPVSRFRYRLVGEGFSSEWRWALDPLAGGTRVVHAATLRTTDRWAELLVRVGGASLGARVEDHLRALKELAESAEADAAGRHDRAVGHPLGPAA